MLFSEKEAEVTNSRGDFTPHARRAAETVLRLRESRARRFESDSRPPIDRATARCDEELGVGDRCEGRREDSLKARLFFAPREK